ncbi:MAG: BTAD domain-containing putative transcriptional regulator [Rhodopila sp.]|nr:BTAD domain-containing putative transcriptional regulator [Rhodopila sp.]
MTIASAIDKDGIPDRQEIVKSPATQESAPRRKLRVSVIGGVHITYGDQEIVLRNRKARAILGYLCLSQTGEEQREKLAGLFWSEFSEQNARATLRQAVHELREALLRAGCSALIGTRTTVGLLAGSFVVDLDEILSAVAARDASEALLRQERLAETLLAGFEDLDPSFHVWLMARRQALHDRLIRGLEEGYRDQTVDQRRRRLLAEATLLLDSTHEEACRIVMRCAAEAGETGAAIRAYDELYRLLDEDYDMEPSAATQELIAEIKQGKFDDAALALLEQDGTRLSYAAEMKQALVPPRRAAGVLSPVPVPSKPALFVDAFGMSGVDPDRVHLVEGFRIELIACLTRFREWYVSSTDLDGSGGQGDVQASARYAVITTAYQAGAAINVVMVLQERPSGLAIWGERFELRLDRWFEAQQRIVRRIAATLNVQLSTERLVRLSHMPDVSLESYDIWLRGQWVIRNFSAADWNRAVEMFAQGIEQAPGFSPLYSSLAQMNNAVHFVQPGMFRDPTKVARTLTLAQRAVALDPRDSRGELCLGWAFAMSKRYAAAEVHMDLACELNTNDPWTLVSAAMFHAFCGNVARAQDLSAQAMEMTLSPTPSHWVYEASIRYLRGDDEGTITAADRAQDALLTLPAWRAMALSNLGRLEEARRDLERFCEGVRANWISEEPPTDEMIWRWFLQVYPISRPELWKRLRDGVAALGMPVQGLIHSGAPVAD